MGVGLLLLQGDEGRKRAVDVERRAPGARPLRAQEFKGNEHVTSTATLVKNLRSELGARKGKKKISRAELAEILGKSPGSIFNWETDRSKPSKRSLRKLEALLSKTTGATQSIAVTPKATPKPSKKSKPVVKVSPKTTPLAKDVAAFATAIGGCENLSVARATFDAVMDILGEKR